MPLPALYSNLVASVAAAGSRVAIVQSRTDVAVSTDGGRTFQPTTLPPGNWLADPLALKAAGTDIFTVAYLNDGNRVMRLSGTDWVMDSGDIGGTSQGEILLAQDGGALVALTGQAVYRRTAGGWSAGIAADYPKFVNFGTALDLDGERLYALSPAGADQLVLYGIELSAPSPVWVQLGKTLQVPNEDSPQALAGTLAVADGYAYVASEKQFSTLELASITGDWQVDLNAGRADWVGKASGRLYRSLGGNLELYANQSWAPQGYVRHAPSGVGVSQSAGGRLFVGTEGGLLQKGLNDWEGPFDATTLGAFPADVRVGTNAGTLYAQSSDFLNVRALSSQGDVWNAFEFGLSAVKAFSTAGGTMFLSARNSDDRMDRVGGGVGGGWLEVAPMRPSTAPGAWQRFAGVSGGRAYLASVNEGAVTVYMHDLTPAGPWVQVAPTLQFNNLSSFEEVAVAGGQVFVTSRGDRKIMACLAPGEGGAWTQLEAPVPSGGSPHLTSAGDVLFLVATEGGEAWRVFRYDRATRAFVGTGEGLDLKWDHGYRVATDGTDLYLAGDVGQAGQPGRIGIRRIPVGGGPAEPFGPELSASVTSLAVDPVGKRLFVGTSDGALVGR